MHSSTTVSTYTTYYTMEYLCMESTTYATALLCILHHCYGIMYAITNTNTNTMDGWMEG